LPRLGTVSFGAVEVLSRAIAEIAALDVDVLVTVGPEGEPASLGEVPDNVHVERFVAQAAVLPLISSCTTAGQVRCSAHSKSGCRSYSCRKVRTSSSTPRS
jgi:hypothetical protein